MNSSQFNSNPNEANHWTPYSHWCAGCWHWVVDCEHVLEPLLMEHRPVEDGCIRSLAYDRMSQRLEVRFKWKSMQQYRPVSLAMAREIWKARPVNTALDAFVKNNRHIRFGEVRSEGKLLMSLMRGWALVAW